MNNATLSSLPENRDASAFPGDDGWPLPSPESVSASLESSGIQNRGRGTQLAALDRMQFLSETTGLPFLCVETDGGTVLAKSQAGLVEWIPWEIRSELPGVTGLRLMPLDSGLVYYALPLPAVEDHPTVAVGYVLQRPGICPREAQSLATEKGWSQDEIDAWCSRQLCCHPKVLERLLSVVLESETRHSALESELTRVVGEVESTCQEIGILHTLTSNLQLTRSPLDLAEQCLDGLYDLIAADGNMIVIDAPHGHRHLLVKGHAPIGNTELQGLISRFATHDWTHPLIKNRVDGTLLGADYSGLHNFILAPICLGEERSGWVLLCNLPDAREFGAVESSLISSVATIMATHHRNQALLAEQEELLLQFIETLVSTLDAKDPYTCGHSERVARIARRIGEEMGLPEDDLEDIYQSGLLHDIGKIGVNDAILQKPADLTNEEFEQVKLHPEIGDHILSRIGSLQKLRPGVRHHHEEYCGRGGYPDNLAGDAIPLMARILAVSDAYDAMRSDRPYRKGLSVDRIEENFRCGAGQQWDPRIIEACFRVWEDVRRIGDEGVFSRGDR